MTEEKVKKYEEYEKRLSKIYGEHDDLLEIIISHLEKPECLQHPEFLPAGKTRLLTDEHVEMWEAYKKLGTPEEIKAQLDVLADIKKKENEWIVTDPDCFQICRPCGNEAYEFYQIQETEPEENSEKRYYGIAHDIVYLCDIDPAKMLAAYGHKSIDELGPEAERILAEYTFETDAQSGANIMSSGPWTFGEAEALIKKIAGFQE